VGAHFSGSGGLILTSTMPNSTNFAFGGWFRIDTDLDGTEETGNAIQLYRMREGATTVQELAMTALDPSPESNVFWDGNGTFPFIGDIATYLTWWYFGLTISSGGDHNLYLRALNESTFSTSTFVSGPYTGSPDTILALRNHVGAFNMYGDVAYWRMWNEEKSEAAMLAESNSATIVDATNVFADWPFVDASTGANDISGNANHWDTFIGASDGINPTFEVPYPRVVASPLAFGSNF